LFWAAPPLKELLIVTWAAGKAGRPSKSQWIRDESGALDRIVLWKQNQQYNEDVNHA